MNLSSNLKPFAWGLISGAIAWWIILAFVFDWTSAGTAQRQAARQTEQSVVAALAPVCADRFLALPNALEKKASLAGASSWERTDLFPKAWVTLPGENSPDHDLVNACSKIVLDAPLPATKEKAAAVPARKDNG